MTSNPRSKIYDQFSTPSQGPLTTEGPYFDPNDVYSLYGDQAIHSVHKWQKKSQRLHWSDWSCCTATAIKGENGERRYPVYRDMHETVETSNQASAGGSLPVDSDTSQEPTQAEQSVVNPGGDDQSCWSATGGNQGQIFQQQLYPNMYAGFAPVLDASHQDAFSQMPQGYPFNLSSSFTSSNPGMYPPTAFVSQQPVYQPTYDSTGYVNVKRENSEYDGVDPLFSSQPGSHEYTYRYPNPSAGGSRQGF